MSLYHCIKGVLNTVTCICFRRDKTRYIHFLQFLNMWLLGWFDKHFCYWVLCYWDLRYDAAKFRKKYIAPRRKIQLYRKLCKKREPWNIWWLSTIFYSSCQGLCTEPSEHNAVNGSNPCTGQHGGDCYRGCGEVNGHRVPFLYSMFLQHVGDSVNHLWQLSVMLIKIIC